jgi:pimeloyl-ACP methyl ester carboxylesterase
VLVHGITSEGAGWGRVAEVLVDRGYRVLAPDLRGHGRSGRSDYTPEAWAGDLVETLEPGADLVLGHSLGGIALIGAVERLRPRRAVYEDPAWVLRDPGEAAATARAYAAQKTWTREQVAAANPRWPERDLVAKLSALEHWDAGTAGWRLAMGPVEFTPTVPPSVPSLVLLADPSTLVPPDRAQRLRELGWEVRTVPGAGHSIHRDDFDGFFTALEGWL